MGMERKEAMEKARRMPAPFSPCDFILTNKEPGVFSLINKCVTANEPLRQSWGPFFSL